MKLPQHVRVPFPDSTKIKTGRHLFQWDHDALHMTGHEMENWIDHNGYRRSVLHMDYSGGAFIFVTTDPDAAFHFKMRWL